jgi:hypothetical protein
MLGRVVLVHLSILGGMFLFAMRDQPASFFSIFVVLKATVDVGTLLPRWEPKDPPAVLVRLASKLPRKKGEESFEAHWRRTRQEELARRERDEEVLPPGGGAQAPPYDDA